MKELGITVFSDFDGTIVRQDIGNELFKHFGQFQPYNSRLKNGEIAIEDYWRIVCDTLEFPADEPFEPWSAEFFTHFVQQFDIDTNFKTFHKFCKENYIQLNVISDGFCNYIQPTLQLLGIDDVTLYANMLIINENSKLEPHFYGASESCECMCASCKRNSVLAYTSPDDVIVYIGDGHSDLCAAEHSDIIFAKNELSAYLNERSIPHYNFSNFFDVYRIMSNVVKQKKYRVRHQAFLKRKKAFECE